MRKAIMRIPNPMRALSNAETRPRAIMWAGVALLGFAVFWSVAIVGTSFEWFCTTPCHSVHDDNTAAYKVSTHHQVSCIACHEPVAANPLVMTLMKVKVLPDLPATIFGTYEMPINPESLVAREMPAEQCTQCHNLANRPETPKAGIIIDHAVHAEAKVTCATCHNRVAHREEKIELTIAGNKKHENWMTMDACYRCHGLSAKAEAPGKCSACHPKDFKLLPVSHEATGWYATYGESGGHAKAGVAEHKSVQAAEKAAASAVAFEVSKGSHADPGLSAEVNSCYTCHLEKFCKDCHGVPMPHPADIQKNHGEMGTKSPSVCARCHARSGAEAKGTGFCTACHHPASRPGKAWRYGHPAEVRRAGAKPCYDCHEETECTRCHVRSASSL